MVNAPASGVNTILPLAGTVLAVAKRMSWFAAKLGVEVESVSFTATSRAASKAGAYRLVVIAVRPHAVIVMYSSLDL